MTNTKSLKYEKDSQKFNEMFSYWDIELPAESVANRQRGKILQQGWVIWYLFGCNKKGEFLDYYASHRMTNDRHERIYENGNIEGLPALMEGRRVSDDPEEDKQLEMEFRSFNQKVSKILEDKGFVIEGDEHPITQVNRALLTNPEFANK